MKAFLIAVLTADGFLAQEADAPADWSSSEDKKFFARVTKAAGVVIMGATTFKTIGRPLKDRLNIVYSKSQSFEGVEMTDKSPSALLADLEKRGYTEAAVIGGPSIYTLFMEAGLIDKIYLTVESLFFGQGVSLFAKPVRARLELESAEKISPTSLVLTYKVVK